MVVSLPTSTVVALDAVAWISWGLITGWWYRRPTRIVPRADGPLLRLRAFETAAWYERSLRIKSWKDRLPETGSRFGEDMSKRRLPGRDRDSLERFAAECRRGERTHWALMGATPAFAVWNSPGLILVMGGCGLVVGGPFIAVLRYNRVRIVAILDTRVPSDTRPPPVGLARADRRRHTSRPL